MARLRPISFALVQTLEAGHAWQTAPEARYSRKGLRSHAVYDERERLSRDSVRMLYTDEREHLSLWTRKAVATLVIGESVLVIRVFEELLSCLRPPCPPPSGRRATAASSPASFCATRSTMHEDGRLALPSSHLLCPRQAPPRHLGPEHRRTRRRTAPDDPTATRRMIQRQQLIERRRQHPHLLSAHRSKRHLNISYPDVASNVHLTHIQRHPRLLRQAQFSTLWPTCRAR